MRNVLRFLLPAAVLLAGLPLCLGWFSQRLGDRAAAESFALVEENVRRAAVECYALEGAYPQDFSYLAERSGLCSCSIRGTPPFLYESPSRGTTVMSGIRLEPM